MKTLALLPIALLSTAAMAQDYPPPSPRYDGGSGQRDISRGADDPAYDDARDERHDDERYARGPVSPGPIDPHTARQVMGAVQAVTDAMLDVRVDGVRQAIDPRDRGGAQTIGDLMARRDPAYREHIRQDMARAAGAAVQAGRTATAVQAAAADFARRIERALNESGY